MSQKYESDQPTTAEVRTCNQPITFLRLRSLLKNIQMSKSWVYRQIQLGNFPAPIKLGGRAVAWPQNSIDQWMTEQIQNSRNDLNGGA